MSKIVEKQGRLSVEQAVDWVLEACEAVAEAHSLGMVHRDLKPANLFLARGPGGTGSIKVLDFGIGKTLDTEAHEGTTGGLTNEGVALGSPGYMAPEQMTSSRDVDVRADIYSLGAILYRLCGGQNPYKGDSLVSILASMAMTPLTPLRSIVPTIPERFGDIVARCLSQEREDRPETVAELARDIATFASRRGRASVDQIMATMGSAAKSLPPSRQLSDPGPTLTTATPRSHHSAPPPHASIGLADTLPLNETVVSPASPKVPSQPSYPPLAPSYPPPMERSDTSPDRLRLAQQRSANFLFALGAGALLAGAIAWVAFTGDPQTPAPTTPPQPVPVDPPPITTPAATTPPTPILIAPPPSDLAPSAPRAEPAKPAKPPPPKPRPGPTHKPDGIPSPTSIPDGRR